MSNAEYTVAEYTVAFRKISPQLRQGPTTHSGPSAPHKTAVHNTSVESNRHLELRPTVKPRLDFTCGLSYASQGRNRTEQILV
jgi:hypothetical protein